MFINRNINLGRSLVVTTMATAALLLAGCGGGGGDAAPATTTTTTTTSSSVTPPTGTSPVTLANLTTDQIAALTPVVKVGGVTIASPPQVTFSIADGATTNNPIIGFGAASSTGALTYLSFALAKLVPAANGSPSKWVSYIVTSTTPGTAQRPSTDNTGTLVDNKNGTYTYTFARDITKAKEQVAAMTMTSPNVAADLGDLTYDPTLTHRMVIQLSGGGMENPVNAVHDFIPATGKAVAATDTQREVVSIDSCNACHEKLALHRGGGRIDTRYCVVCHTDQRKFGRSNVASTANAFPALTETATPDTTTGITSYTYSPATYVADGHVSGDFPNLVHKIHQGHSLVKQNYNYANVAFNNKAFSILNDGQKMCSKCHDNTKAAQADNWNTAPSRLACGSCHDGINFADGTGTTLDGATTGHAGINLAQTSDATCALCHASADIKRFHQADNVTKHNPTVATGLANFSYEIASATATATETKVKFRIKKDGTPLTSLAVGSGQLTGFTGGPSFLLIWGAAQDGITTPVDFNNYRSSSQIKQGQPISVSSIANLLNGTGGSISAVDADGYFTATLTGNNVFPTGAVMRTVAMQSYYTQTGMGGRHALSAMKTVTGDTARREIVSAAKCSNCHEWLELHGGSRVIGPESTSVVCVACHNPAMASSGRGVSDTFLGTYKFDATLLADWKAEFGFDPLNGSNRALKFPVVSNNLKDLVHGLHAGRDRVKPFKTARDRSSSGVLNLLDFRRMDFPGVLSNCETCHIAGTYANVSSNALASTQESIDAAYAAASVAGTATAAIAKTALSTANAEDKVTSPFAAACISCHDSVAAQAHVATQGGLILGTRAAFQTKVATPGQGEACATCHGVGRAEDVTVAHK